MVSRFHENMYLVGNNQSSNNKTFPANNYSCSRYAVLERYKLLAPLDFSNSMYFVVPFLTTLLTFPSFSNL